jgi:hypothetical protein
MLFRQRDHEAIEGGAITMTVRAWRRPQARVGGVYRLHARGVVVVDEVTRLAAADLGEEDASACGYASVSNLLEDLDRANRGGPDVEELTRVRFHYEERPDARPELAADDRLDGATLETLRRRLEAMDRHSRHGPWTLDTLRLIEARPHVVSTRLANELGREPRPFKADVRKLKNLGLTISHEVGYELSPRGAALLSGLAARDEPP